MTLDSAHKAIKKGQMESLKAGIEASLDVNETSKLGGSLLMLAALTGNCKVGDFLIGSRASLDARNNFNDTPISLAAHTGRYRFVRLLIDSGATDVGEPHGRDVFDFIQNWSGLPQATLTRTIAELRRIA